MLESDQKPLRNADGESSDPDDRLFIRLEEEQTKAKQASALESSPILSARDTEGRPPSNHLATPSRKNAKMVEDQIRAQMKKAVETDKQRKSKRKTTQMLLKEQIEESRKHLQQEITQRMQAQKEIRELTEGQEQLKEGISDILGVVADIHSQKGILA